MVAKFIIFGSILQFVFTYKILTKKLSPVPLLFPIWNARIDSL